MLKRHDIVTSGTQGNALSHTEFEIQQKEKVKKTYRKRKEGTEGLDACDEIHEAERLSEGFKMMSSNDD